MRRFLLRRWSPFCGIQMGGMYGVVRNLTLRATCLGRIQKTPYCVSYRVVCFTVYVYCISYRVDLTECPVGLGFPAFVPVCYLSVFALRVRFFLVTCPRVCCRSSSVECCGSLMLSSQEPCFCCCVSSDLFMLDPSFCSGLVPTARALKVRVLGFHQSRPSG